MRHFLGLHFGHDASASIVTEDGTCIVSVLQERLTRVRHDYGLDVETVDAALRFVGLSIREISGVGITSTQQMPAFTRSPRFLRLLGTRDDEDDFLGRVVPESVADNPWLADFFKDNLFGLRRIPPSRFREWECYVVRDPVRVVLNRFENRGVSELVESAVASANHYSCDQLNYSLVLEYRGIQVPCRYWSHHAGHAASNAAVSDASRWIITHDGGTGLESGGLWRWSEGRLDLASPHLLELGQLYDFFAERLGLGVIGGAGKLMGLAAYGAELIELPEGLAGNLVDQAKCLRSPLNSRDVYEGVWNSAINRAVELGLEIETIGDRLRVTESAPAEMANFVQRLVSEAFSLTARELLRRTKSDALGVSGGFALNCPTNSRIFDEHPHTNVIVEPHCEDGGCSIGAAFLESMVSSRSRDLTHKKRHDVERVGYPFLGLQNLVDFGEVHGIIAGEPGLKEVTISKPSDLPKVVAGLIADGVVVGVLQGRSEVGPRALGHRSILADPRPRANWGLVNEIKRRESWRPFAPVILQDRLRDFFVGGPDSSPFMLFNYEVAADAKDRLRAITHVDGTARVQTMPRGSSFLADVLEEFERLTGIPLLLNTSLNGPGEPVHERAEEAISFFRQSDLGALVIGEALVVK